MVINFKLMGMQNHLPTANAVASRSLEGNVDLGTSDLGISAL
jgi:hypothetical protein